MRACCCQHRPLRARRVGAFLPILGQPVNHLLTHKPELSLQLTRGHQSAIEYLTRPEHPPFPLLERPSCAAVVM